MSLQSSLLITPEKDYETTISILQHAVDQITSWLSLWKIKLNEAQSIRVHFFLRPHRYICTPTVIKDVPVPVANQARYLGLDLDATLNWQEHVKRKKELRKLLWLVGPRS